MRCMVCDAPVYAKGRCRSCYVYFRRHKADRTEAALVARARRRLNDELAERAYGRLHVLVDRR